jgi:hypothetical protein
MLHAHFGCDREYRIGAGHRVLNNQSLPGRLQPQNFGLFVKVNAEGAANERHKKTPPRGGV